MSHPTLKAYFSTQSPVFYVFNSYDWLDAWIRPELSLIQLRYYTRKRRAASSQLYDSKQTSHIVMNISVSLKSILRTLLY